ncbi:MAG TPA: trehalase family glycosidase [Candidatus Limnocylindrales bacterium]|nr:trehalase family glycosidase [Candidatus Limnocylindrales bacterium]
MSTPGRQARRPSRLLLAVLAVIAVLGAAGLAWRQLAVDPAPDLPAWNELDTRWGTYLSERQWGTPREAIDGDGWGLDYITAIRREYATGEDGIAGLTTRDGAFNLGWAVWDERGVRVIERLFGWSNPAGEHGESIVDLRTFGANTPTSSYTSYELDYPNQDPRFAITFESARADERSGILVATAVNRGPDAAPLDILVKGWLHDPDADPGKAAIGKDGRLVELVDGGLLLFGHGSVVAIVGGPPTSAQVSDDKRAIDENLRDGGLHGRGHGHIGALAYRLDLAAAESTSLQFAWAEDTDPAKAEARARDLLGDAGTIVGFRRSEADGLFRGEVSDHEPVYRAALQSLLWSQVLYTWDGTSSYDPAWAGKVSANDVLIMPDKWEFPWLATWDTGFQAVAASLVDPQLGADQLRFLFSDKWQQPDGHLPCAEWVMTTECPPIFAWAARRVAAAGAGDAFLREVYPGLQHLFDYWWATNAVVPEGLFSGGFLGMDNLPRGGDGRPQADASAWMAFFARDLGAIATQLGDTASADRYDADVARIAAAVNAHLWDDEAGFYFDVDADGEGFIPTKSYSGLIPLIAGIVPADRQARVLEAVRDPGQFWSEHGIRSTSAFSVVYEPGYARGGGVNSNWRGPIWVPINYLLVEALEALDPDLARDVRVRVVATVEAGWTATGHFHEYYDGDTGAGLGADQQTGWTALVANLVAEGWPAR